MNSSFKLIWNKERFSARSFHQKKLTMPLISTFLLGLVVASVFADDQSNSTEQLALSTETSNNNSITETPDIINITSTTSTVNHSYSTSPTTTRNVNHSYSTSPTTTRNVNHSYSTSASTTRNDVERSTDISQTATSDEPSSTPRPIYPIKSTTKGAITPSKVSQTDNTGIIIVVVIILIALGFGLYCFLSRQRRRRYSIDLTSRQDEASIPLSTMPPELPGETTPQNGLLSFESSDVGAKEPEPESKTEAQEEQKAEASKPAGDNRSESSAPSSGPAPSSDPAPSSGQAPSSDPAPSTGPAPSSDPAPAKDHSEDKPKVDVTEQSPPAPVEEKTDDEGAVSNKTSVESLKEANENNSSNADFKQRSWYFEYLSPGSHNAKTSDSPSDVSLLDCPV